MAKHLIKRRDLDYKFKDGWRCETRLGRWPNGSKVKPGDVIYVAQNGYAIFGMGIVEEVRLREFNTITEFLVYIFNESNIKDDVYWMSKLREFSQKSSLPIIKLLEYKLIKTNAFDYTISLESRFLAQSSWYYLEDEYEPKVPNIQDELTLHIPSKIRSEVYHNFKIQSDRHLIDVDHFVPRDIYGPGNIIENLVPISASINRTKSNKVPSKLLDFAEKFGFKKPKGLVVSHDKFYSDKESIILGRKIVLEINKQQRADLKETYRKIRQFHFPYLK